MKQYDLINKIIDGLVSNHYIHYAFLKGSFANGSEDVYSNVEIYVKLRIEKEDEFFASYLQIFELYKPIIFFKQYEYSFINIVYKDYINLKVHFVDDLKNVNIDNHIVKLYDPDSVLDDLYDYNLELSDYEIASVVDEMSLKCYEFHRLFLRNEYSVIMHVVSDIHRLYSMIMHYKFSKKDSMLGINKVFTNMAIDDRKRFVEILMLWKLDTIKDCVCMMMEDVYNVITSFSLDIANNFNFDFYSDVKNKIMLL